MQFETGSHAKNFLLAGKAITTFVSKRTGTRYTYKIVRPTNETPWFVKVLIGSNNATDYMFIGTIFNDGTFRAGRNTNREAKNIKAFEWVWRRINKENLPEEVEIYHEGRCGCCGRVLTTPESIKSGFGPICSKR